MPTSLPDKKALSIRPSKVAITASIKIATIYLLIGCLWIFFSDRLLNLALQDPSNALTQFQTFKGWFYVIATTGILYWLIDRESRVSQRAATRLHSTFAELLATQEALKHSEERFRAMVEEAFDAMSIVSATGQIIYTSPNSDRILGNPPDKVLAQTWGKDLHPDDVAEAAALWATLFEQPPETVRTNSRMRHQDGSWRWIEATARNMIDHPAIGGILVNWRDVTDRKLAEAALQRSEEQFRLAFDFAQIGSWDWDLRTNQITWNQNHFHLLGLNPDTDEASYNNWRDRLHPEDVTRTEAAVNASLSNRTAFQAEYRLIHPDGTLHWVIGKGRAIYDPAGRPIRMIGVMLDITDRKQIEDQVRQQFNLLKMAQQAAQMGVYEWDLVTNQAYWTPEMEILMGMKLEERPNNLDAWFAQVHPEDRVRFEQLLPHWLGLGQQMEANEYRFDRNGEERWIDARGYILRDGDGRAVRMIGTNLDITDRKRTEAALRESQLQLQQRLAEIETIYQSAPIGLNVLDTDLRFVRINQRLAEINGFSIEAHLGHTVREILPDLADAAEELLRPILETGDPLWNVELIGETPAQPGVQRIWLEHFLPLKDGNRVIGINTVCEEITDRKRTEDLLRLRERQFRQAIINAPYPIILHAEDGEVVQINQVWTELTGYEAGDIPTIADWTEKAYGQRRAIAQAAIDRLYSLDTRVSEGEFTLQTKDGRERIWDFSSAPLGCLPDGRRLVMSMAVDVTERKQLERTLRQQAERLQLTNSIAQRIRQSLNLKEILNTTVVEVKQWLYADRVIVYQFAPDVGGRIVAESVTPGWRVSLGDEIEDTCFQTGAGEDYRRGQHRMIPDIYEAGLTDCHLQLLEQFEVKANLIIPILLMGEESQNHLWGLLIVHQCSASKTWQPEQVDLLEQIALQLAIAIQQAQVFEQAQRELVERQQAERHLRTALTEKEVLLKEIHHRVKNNLQIVSGLLQLQAHGLSDPEIANALRESQTRIESMSLIHKKLYTSSDLGQIDVADYIQGLAMSLLTTYQIAPGTVTLRVDVEPVLLSLDQAIPCGLIINELVSNALKYAFPNNRPGEINIKLCQSYEQLELTIQDNGVGLPQDLNWREPQTLGLSLVHALATEQLDGSFAVDLSEGSRFDIRFPR